MKIVAAPSILIDGVVRAMFWIDVQVKIGLSPSDLAQLQKKESRLVECDTYSLFYAVSYRNNIDSLIRSGSSGYFTASLISYIGNLLNCPFTVSGFIKGLDKIITTSSCDIESLRSSHSTVNLLSFFDSRT